MTLKTVPIVILHNLWRYFFQFFFKLFFIKEQPTKKSLPFLKFDFNSFVCFFSLCNNHWGPIKLLIVTKKSPWIQNVVPTGYILNITSSQLAFFVFAFWQKCKNFYFKTCMLATAESFGLSERGRETEAASATLDLCLPDWFVKCRSGSGTDWAACM